MDFFHLIRRTTAWVEVVLLTPFYQRGCGFTQRSINILFRLRHTVWSNCSQILSWRNIWRTCYNRIYVSTSRVYDLEDLEWGGSKNLHLYKFPRDADSVGPEPTFQDHCYSPGQGSKSISGILTSEPTNSLLNTHFWQNQPTQVPWVRNESHCTSQTHFTMLSKAFYISMSL